MQMDHLEYYGEELEEKIKHLYVLSFFSTLDPNEFQSLLNEIQTVL